MIDCPPNVITQPSAQFLATTRKTSAEPLADCGCRSCHLFRSTKCRRGRYLTYIVFKSQRKVYGLCSCLQGREKSFVERYYISCVLECCTDFYAVQIKYRWMLCPSITTRGSTPLVAVPFPSFSQPTFLISQYSLLLATYFYFSFALSLLLFHIKRRCRPAMARRPQAQQTAQRGHGFLNIS